MQHALKAAEYQESSVDDNGGKHGSRNSGAVLGIVGAAYEFMVIAGEDTAEDGEDDDGEDGDDDARPCLHRTNDGLHDGRDMVSG